MGEHSYQIKEYMVELLGTSAVAEDQDLRAKVLLFSEDRKHLVGELRFYQPPKLWMKSDQLIDTKRKKPKLIGHMSIQQLPSVVDVLRNEDPIYILWLDKQNQISLRTYLEPAGEGEK
jgi:hypothetical protein